MDRFKAIKNQVLSLAYIAIACAAALLAGGATSSSAQVLRQTLKGVVPMTCGESPCMYVDWLCSIQSGACHTCEIDTCLLSL